MASIELNEDNNLGKHTINRYAPGTITINKQDYDHSVIITSEILEPWPPGSIDELTAGDIRTLLAHQPQIVIIGTGSEQVFLPDKLLKPLISRNIGHEIMSTHRACTTFNVLASEGRNVLAALIIA